MRCPMARANLIHRATMPSTPVARPGICCAARKFLRDSPDRRPGAKIEVRFPRSTMRPGFSRPSVTRRILENHAWPPNPFRQAAPTPSVDRRAARTGPAGPPAPAVRGRADSVHWNNRKGTIKDEGAAGSSHSPLAIRFCDNHSSGLSSRAMFCVNRAR